MRLIGDIVPLYFKTRRKQKKEERLVKKRYYQNSPFAAVDRALKRAYFLRNPYTINRRFLQHKNEQDLHTYGETYLTSFERIAHTCGLSSSDHIIELGCGRGRGVFFWHYLLQARVQGIDWNPYFITKAKELQQKHAPQAPISFNCNEIDNTDLSQATAVYLYASHFEDTEIEKLLETLITCRPGCKVITVSYPLTEYQNASHFELKKVFPIPYLWGEAEVFLNVRKS